MLSVDQLEDKLIDLAFAEDIGDGDHTTLCCIPEDAMGKSHLLIKEDGVLAGVEMAKKVFARFDPTMKVEVLLQDGTHVKKGDIAMIVEGKTRSLLQTERLMLNIMQRMSGIATMTAKYVKRLEGTKTHILDTRKTTPGLRMLEMLPSQFTSKMDSLLFPGLKIVYQFSGIVINAGRRDAVALINRSAYLIQVS